MSERTRAELKLEYKQTPIPMGIYQIRNKQNNKTLVGSSPNLNAIFNRERFGLNNGSHFNKELQKDWNEAGPGNFEFEILEVLETDHTDPKKDREDLAVLEELWLEKLQPYNEKGYNKVPVKK